MSKRSRFFCENCGGEVKANAKVCPHCGRFFSAVRCPVCGFTGESGLFVRGCPSCGYAGMEDEARSRKGGFEIYDVDHLSGEDSGRRGGRTDPARKSGGGVPSWVYWLAMALLGAFFLIMAVIYVRL